MTEATAAALTGIKFGDAFKFDLHHRHEDHLRNAFANFDGKSTAATIPAGNENLALIIRVDQTDQIAKHDTVFVPQTGARQQDCRQLGSSI